MEPVTFSNGGCVIQYDPVHHVLIHEGKPVFREQGLEPLRDNKNKVFKSNDPSVIRISMGSACNMGCSYCLQDTLSPDRNKQHNNALHTVEQLKHLDLSRVEEIQLWGGEPLLYWRYIKTFVETLDYKGKYSIVTNATKLTVNHVDWMLASGHEWVIAMSHDALQHNLLRGEDFLTNPKSREAIDHALVVGKGQIHFSFNSVITNANWDVYKTVQFFYRHYPTIPVNFELMTAYDENSKAHVLSSNLQRHRESISRLINASINNDPTIGHHSFYHFGLGLMKVKGALTVYDENVEQFGCGVANADILTIDHKGQLIVCQNTFNDPTKVYGELNAINAADITKSLNISKKRSCVTCPVQRLCKQTCPLLERESEYDGINCNIRFHHYLQILESTISFVFKQTKEMKLTKE